MFIKIFQRPNIHRSNIINDSVTQTSFFLTQPLIINNLTETAIHCHRYVTYQITSSVVTTAMVAKAIYTGHLLTILEKTPAIYRIFRSVYLEKFAMQ